MIFKKLLLIGLLFSTSISAGPSRVLNATKVQNGSGSISIPSATNVTGTEASYLSGVTSALQTQIDSKEPNITVGTSLQYWRGDKSFTTLDTSAVPENANLYYTNARVQTAAKNNTSAQQLYVSKDIGSDSNDCTILKPCQTIGFGITTANALASYGKQVVLHVAPSTSSGGFVENLTLSQQGVNLQCDAPVQNTRACLVAGRLTVNLTGVSGGGNFIAASNEVYVNGFVFTAGANNALTFSGTTFQRLILVNSYMQSTSVAAAVISNTGVSGSTPSTVSNYDTVYANNAAGTATISLTGGRFWMFGTQPTITNSNAAGDSLTQSGASTNFICNLCTITGRANITDNTANATFNLATINSGSNACIGTPASASTGVITLAYFGCTSSATNSVTGSGVVVPVGASARLSSSGDIIGTVTQAVVPGFPQGEMQLGAGAASGTNVLLSLKGGHVKVTQTTAPTAVVNANAGTSATCTLTNASDTSGIVNLTEGSASWASGTQCTVTFNKAYGVAPNCIFSANNAATAGHQVSQQVNVTTTTTTMIVTFGVADAAATVYKFMYMCFET